MDNGTLHHNGLLDSRSVAFRGCYLKQTNVTDIPDRGIKGAIGPHNMFTTPFLKCSSSIWFTDTVAVSKLETQ